MYSRLRPLKKTSNQPLRKVIISVSQNRVVFFNKHVIIIKPLIIALLLMKIALFLALMPFREIHNRFIILGKASV